MAWLHLHTAAARGPVLARARDRRRRRVFDSFILSPRDKRGLLSRVRAVGLRLFAESIRYNVFLWECVVGFFGINYA